MKYIPEFKALRVLKDKDSTAGETVPLKRHMTVRSGGVGRSFFIQRYMCVCALDIIDIDTEIGIYVRVSIAARH